MAQPNLFQELLEACIGFDGNEKCIVCGSHHDTDHVTYDDDTSCVVSRILVTDRACEKRSFFTEPTDTG